MHTYRKSRNEELWTVGYYVRNPGGYDEWVALSDHGNETEARYEVRFLNGGNSAEPRG